MRHLVVTRFSVPRPESGTHGCHCDPEWLEGRLRLFERYFVPSVGRLGVPAVLLCSSASAATVADRVRRFDWVRVVEEDHWHAGWTGTSDQIITRHDSDDALHEGWLRRLEETDATADVVATTDFLRLDEATGRLHRYRRREISPLATFRHGLPPFAHDHAHLARHHRMVVVRGAWLLQVAHGGNVANARPKWWRFDRRVPRSRLAAFGL